MDKITNPFSGSAGNRPAKLAGREDIVRDIEVMLARVQAGKSERCFILRGLRGVGKTTLLVEAQRMAEKLGHQVVRIEMPEKRQSARLIEVIGPDLRTLLTTWKPIGTNLKAAFEVLSDLLERVQLNTPVGTLSLQTQAAPKNNMESDLRYLFELLGKAVRDQKRCLLISIDEMQYMEKIDLSALSMAMHNVSQLSLPIAFMGAALPQIRGIMGDAKTYAERLMKYASIDRLDEVAAFDALQSPAQDNGVAFAQDALQHIFKQTRGYPYFLQVWGQNAWNIAERSPITLADVHAASASVMRELDASFFRVRFDKMTPSEKTYAHILAQRGEGAHRSGDIAQSLGKASSQVAPIRARLMHKGIIHSPEHGLIEFSAPLFEDFLKRAMGRAMGDSLEEMDLPLS